MTPFEITYLLAAPFLGALYQQVRKITCLELRARRKMPTVLDVGGRKSHYTIGLNAEVTITDLPRASAIQETLNLGITDLIVEQIRRRRSNVKDIVFDDMTHSRLPSSSFDLVLAVEVLEHVEQDTQFVQEVYRVLKQDGAFVMTTPNGDYRINTNPDHKRHYRREALVLLLHGPFQHVDVRYAVRTSMFWRRGLKAWSIRRPIVTFLSGFGNCLNFLESRSPTIAEEAYGTAHLIAVARKRKHQEIDIKISHNPNM